MKYKYIYWLVGLGCLSPCCSQQVLSNQVTTTQQGYIQIPDHLVINSSIHNFVQQVQTVSEKQLLSYLQDLGFVIDQQVQSISLKQINYLTDSDHNLSSLDLSFKLINLDHSISYQHLNLPVTMFAYLIHVPDQIDFTYAQFSQALSNQAPSSLFRFLQDNHFQLDSQLQVIHFQFDEITRILTLSFVDQVTNQIHYQGSMNVNLNSISFLKPNDQVINNSGLYLSIGLSVLIFLSLGIYLTRFVIKIKHLKHKPQSKTQQDSTDEHQDQTSENQEDKQPIESSDQTPDQDKPQTSPKSKSKSKSKTNSKSTTKK